MKGRPGRVTLAGVTIMIVLSAVLLPGCGKEAEPGADYREAMGIARTETWQAINSGTIGSASVAVVDGGSVVYSEGFGPANREESIPVDTDVIFNIGSVSKAFCAVAVMLLVDEGTVDLDKPLKQYLPGFEMKDPRHEDITVRMLLDHTSGIPGTSTANNFGYDFNESVYEGTLENLSGAVLKADPGAAAPYCNDGFTLAEMLVVEVSGTGFADFLKENVFEPLSMDSGGPSVGMRSDRTAAIRYQADTGQEEPLEVLSILGAGGLSMSAVDLARFGYSFSGQGPRVLSASSIEAMTTPHLSLFARKAVEEASVNPEMAYGLGLDITGLPRYQEHGVQIIGKGGDTIDSHTMMWAVPGEGLSVAMTNTGAANKSADISLKMVDSILVAKGVIEPEEEEVSVPGTPEPMPEYYRTFDGYYSSTPAYRSTFSPETASLDMVPVEDDTGLEPMTLSYEDGQFLGPSGEKLIYFQVDGQVYCAASVFGGACMNMSQRLEELPSPLELEVDMEGVQWLRRNAKPYESRVLDPTYVSTSRVYPWLPGYVYFGDIMVVTSNSQAGMISGMLRDLSGLEVYEEGGLTWVRTYDMLFSSIDAAAPLGKESREVAVSDDGLNHWSRASEELKLSFELPGEMRLLVFSPEGDSLYDSIIDQGDASVPEGGFIMVAGEPGDSVTIRAE